MIRNIRKTVFLFLLVQNFAVFAQQFDFEAGSALLASNDSIIMKYKPPSVSLGDYNQDGLKDLVIGEGFNTDHNGGIIRVFLNKGTANSPLYEESEIVKADGKVIVLANG